MSAGAHDRELSPGNGALTLTARCLEGLPWKAVKHTRGPALGEGDVGQRVALVHGLLVVDGGPARPHAWVRVGLAGGGTLDLDPTSLDPVTRETHLPLAVAEPGGPSVEAGERWLALLRGEHRVVSQPRAR
jgi:hypothetical protein